MSWYLYRITSGEVMGASVNEYPDLPVDLGQVELDVTEPQPWIHDAGTIRTATQVELDGFPAAETLDAIARTRLYAVNSLQNVDDHAGQLIRALALVTLDEINILRAQDGLSPRTPAQLKIAIKNKIENNQAD